VGFSDSAVQQHLAVLLAQELQNGKSIGMKETTLRYIRAHVENHQLKNEIKRFRKERAKMLRTHEGQTSTIERKEKSPK